MGQRPSPRSRWVKWAKWDRWDTWDKWDAWGRSSKRGNCTRDSGRIVLPPAIVERSAIIEEGYYCDPDAADRRALAEAGHPSWQNFSDGHRLRIAAALKELPPPRDHNGRRLIAETRRFLGSNWFPLALECGWTLDELFGVDALAPLERFEQWGLVVGLALAPKPGDMIEHLDAEHAVIRYRVGALLKEARRNEGRFVPEVASVPWWECPALVGEADWSAQ